MIFRHRSRAAATVEASEPPEFSLVHGGPLFQLTRRAHLSGPSLELLHRRILTVTLVAWLPLLLLSVLGGRAFAGVVTIPFLYDIETHVRLLIALPLIVAAEVVVDIRISPLVRCFVERRIVVADDLRAFNAAVRSTMRADDSVAAEIALLILVYTLGVWLWQSQMALAAATWYAGPAAGHLQLTAAGYWNAFVSIPIFQFLLLRWYLRIVLWFRLLWRISRLELQLAPSHPDQAGGLGFLGRSAHAFGPILLAQGAVLSGAIASRVLYDGQNLTSFTVEAASLVGALVLFILGPLVMFTPKLDRAKRAGLAAYSMLASRYVFRFEEKWIRAGGMEKDDLLGSGDIQSLADLANSYQVVRAMRLVPFGRDDVIRLVATTAAPLLPLALTVFPLQELVTRLIKLLL